MTFTTNSEPTNNYWGINHLPQLHWLPATKTKIMGFIIKYFIIESTSKPR